MPWISGKENKKIVISEEHHPLDSTMHIHLPLQVDCSLSL
jgi:hypothetical protein